MYFQNGVNALSKVVKKRFFCKKLQSLCSLDGPILFEFHLHVVQIFSKGTYGVSFRTFKTSSVRISNGNMEEF